MLTRRRVIAVVLLLVVAAVAYTCWLVWHAERELTKAQSAVTRLQSALENGNADERRQAEADLRDAASSARSATSGFWWGGLTQVPWFGDDAGGVRDLSSSVDLLATGAVPQLTSTADQLQGIVHDGSIDVAKLQAVTQPVAVSHATLDRALAQVQGVDSSGFVSRLRTRFDDYVKTLTDIDSDVASADRALPLMPKILGADGTRSYLFTFQTNAQLRASGGIPGSWALLTVDDGKIHLAQQGADTDFRYYPKGVTTLPADQRKEYGPQYGAYFTDSVFTPDYPTAAKLLRAFWNKQHPQQPIDGVVSIDPVALSYLLRGTGPVTLDSTTLTPENVVSYLESDVYRDVPDIQQQDKLFQQVAKGLFDAITSHVQSPLTFASGIDRATSEGRFRFVSFDDDVAGQLQTAPISGALSGDDGSTPHVDVGINDATGAKMSYYLRFPTEVRSMSCSVGTQQLTGTMELSQTIDQATAARTLPSYVLGDGGLDAGKGSQLVIVRLYGPYGGTISKVKAIGQALPVTYTKLDGRPVARQYVIVDGTDDVTLTWQMTTGAGQTDSGKLGVTPSLVSGPQSTDFASSC